MKRPLSPSEEIILAELKPEIHSQVEESTVKPSRLANAIAFELAKLGLCDKKPYGVVAQLAAINADRTEVSLRGGYLLVVFDATKMDLELAEKAVNETFEKAKKVLVHHIALRQLRALQATQMAVST